MTVYLVFLRGWGDNNLEAIYASREEAQTHVNKLSEFGLDSVVEEKIVIGAWQLKKIC